MKKKFILAAAVLAAGCASLKTSGEYVFRGESYIKDGKVKEAVASYDKAIKINPANADAYAQRGVARYMAGDFDGAAADLGEVIKNQPFRAEAYSALAAALAAKKDYDAALKNINASLYLNPNSAEAFFSRGSINFAMGQYEQALNDYTMVITMRPFADAYRARAMVHEALGDKESMERDLLDAATPGMSQHINVLYGNN